jgi:hypothetical protein
MSLAGLQLWLLQEGIRDDLDAIIRLSVRTELDNLLSEPTTPSWRNRLAKASFHRKHFSTIRSAD